VAIFAVKLTNAIGAQGPAIMIIYLVISGFFLTLLRKPVAQMVNTIIHFLTLEILFFFVFQWVLLIT